MIIHLLWDAGLLQDPPDISIFQVTKATSERCLGVCCAPWLAGQVVAVGNTGASGDTVRELCLHHIAGTFHWEKI